MYPMAKFVSKSSPLLLAATLVFSTALLTGCNNAGASNNVDTKPEVVPIPVEVSALSIGDVSSQYKTTTVLEAKNEAEVISKAAGIIEKIYVEEGDYVEQGQVLAQVEQTRLMLNLNKAKAEMASIEHELARVNKVHKQNLISTDTYDKLKWQFESAKSSVELAKLNLAESKIVAPIAGYIAKRYVKEGNLVEQYQKQKLFHIVDPSLLQGVLNLPEQELAQLKVAQQATLLLSTYPNKQFIANIKRISPIIDAQSGTFRATIEMSNPEMVLKPGMFAEVKLNYDTHEDVVLLPRKSLISMDNKHVVYEVQDNIVVKKQIELGYFNDTMIEVISGLNADSKVVITGQNNLKDQAVIEVINAI